MIAAYIQVYDVLWIFILTIIWHNIFILFGFYKSKRMVSLQKQAFEILKAISVCIVFYLIITWMFRRTPLGPKFVLFFWCIASGTMVFTRISLQLLLRYVRLNKRNLRHVLIIGTNERARKFGDKISKNPEFGYHLIGFADNEWEGIVPFRKEGHALVCNLDTIYEYLRHHVVDAIYIALPLQSYYQWVQKFLIACEDQGVEIHHTSEFFNFRNTQTDTDELENIALVRHYTGMMRGGKVAIKRLMDIFIASLLLLIFSPLFLVIAILIKATSRGPVFFVQKRIGFNKRIFPMYKFRTMVDGAEAMQKELEKHNEVSGPVFKIKNDPRVTSIGKFLRRTSIDEIPQLINVFKGDMSLVGPRPLPLRDYAGFDNDRFRRRCSVLPGITCIWQSNGRSDVPFERWMEMDLSYIDTWTIILDIKILAQTFFSVVRGTGAT